MRTSNSTLTSPRRAARGLGRPVLGFLAAAAALFLAPAALADDTVHLKNGKAITGEILREEGGLVWLKYTIGGVEQTEVYASSDIERIDRDTPEAVDPATDPKPDAAAAPGADPKADPTVAPAPSATRHDGAPRAVVLTLGELNRDMVGSYMTAKPLRDAIPVLEQDGVDIVVFHINSGGGYLLEIQRLSDVIQEEFKPRFRTVAWIESAISAAAMTAHVIEEIYFFPEGNYGACTGYSGGAGGMVAIKDRGLEEVLFMMEKISARGGYSPYIMRSMQIDVPLSCDIDRNGDVIWYDNEQGAHLVNPKGRILTFNSESALKYGFSKGTASNINELAKAMQVPEVEWVGVKKRGYAYPISRAEQMQIDYRAKVEKDEKSLNEYWRNYQQAIGIAQSEEDKQKRGMWVGKAKAALKKIKSMVENNPNFAFFVFNKLPSEWEDWLDEQEQLLRDLMR